MGKQETQNIYYSVIVPIFNQEKWLKKCVDSILAQTYKNFELILVDDGSTDESPQICDNYANEDDRVIVIHKENAGLCAARNTGLHKAKGEHIIYVDGDDWIKPNLLESCHKISKQHNPDLIVFNFEHYFGDHTKEYPATGHFDGFYDKQRLMAEIYPFLFPVHTKHLIDASSCNKVFKRRILLKHFCQNEDIVSGEDGAFTYEYLYNASSAYFLNKSLYVYNKTNEKSITANVGVSRKLILYEYIYKQFENASQNIKEQIGYYYINDICLVYFVMQCKEGKKYPIIRQQLEDEQICKYVPCIKMRWSTPIITKGGLFLLKLKLYRLTYLIAKLIAKVRY